jgi:drug/metabolite transporter (DMT)-like permease
MSAGLTLWLGGAMLVFLAASATLRHYVDNSKFWVLLIALCLYTLGNLMMVRLMRESGMAVAISVSAVLQLVLASAVGLTVFGERPTALQAAGLALGIVAVALIVWPQRGQG